MKTCSAFSVFPFFLMVGCGIAVDDRTQQGGDGDTSGDGDRPLPGVGASNGDGDFGVGDGDLIIGDGDIGGRPTPGQPGIGGSPGGGPIGQPLVGCEETYGYTGSDYCELQYTCENGWNYVYCDSWNGQTNCGCDSSHISMSVQPSGSFSGSTCREVASLCQNPEQVLAVEPVCERAYSYSEPSYCSANAECRREVPLAGGTAVTTSEWREAWCGNDQNGWLCECYGYGNGYWHSYFGNMIRIELSGAQSSTTLCNDFLDICGTDTLQPTGATECAPRSQWSDRVSCQVELECGYPAKLAGQAVHAYEYKAASCQAQGGNVWGCYCGNESFSVQSSNSWDACGAAADVCGSR